VASDDVGSIAVSGLPIETHTSRSPWSEYNIQLRHLWLYPSVCYTLHAVDQQAWSCGGRTFISVLSVTSVPHQLCNDHNNKATRRGPVGKRGIQIRAITPALVGKVVEPTSLPHLMNDEERERSYPSSYIEREHESGEGRGAEERA